MITSPLDLLVRKRLIERAEVDRIALQLLIYFDAMKRRACPDYGVNMLTRHLVGAMYIARSTRSKEFDRVIDVAYQALYKAIQRPGEQIALTTGEYADIRIGLAMYLRALPKIEIGLLVDATRTARSMMKMDI